jgi:hypothetical protein
MTLQNIVADFQLLDDWEDRYRYVIERAVLAGNVGGSHAPGNRIGGTALAGRVGRIRTLGSQRSRLSSKA